MAPLISEVNEKKVVMENRLENLRSVAQGKETLEVKMEEVKTLQSVAEKQREALVEIMGALKAPIEEVVEEPAVIKAVS